MSIPSPELIETVKRRVIMAMFADDELMDRLVLKGGNLLDIVYGISARASADLDFSVDGDLGDVAALRFRIERTLKATFAEIGYEVFDVRVREVPTNLTPDMAAFWGGYQVEFKIIERAMSAKFAGDLEQIRRNAAGIGSRGSSKFEIDISKHEYCAGKLPREFENLRIYAYSPAMIVGEKLRAICQQMPEYSRMVRSHASARARDFVDIHTVAERLAVDFQGAETRLLLRDLFRAKRVPLGLLGRIVETREYHRPDFEAVKATVKAGQELLPFDSYFEYVLELIKPLEPFRDE